MLGLLNNLEQLLWLGSEEAFNNRREGLWESVLRRKDGVNLHRSGLDEKVAVAGIEDNVPITSYVLLV